MPIQLPHAMAVAAVCAWRLPYWPAAVEAVYGVTLMLVAILVPYAILRTAGRPGAAGAGTPS